MHTNVSSPLSPIWYPCIPRESHQTSKNFHAMYLSNMQHPNLMQNKIKTKIKK